MDIVKEKNPYFCYICQRVYHSKCLENWEKEKGNLTCPNCRYKLPLSQWNKKLDYEKKRQNDLEIINQLNKDSLSYTKYKEKTSNILKGVLNKFSEIRKRIKLGPNNKLNNLNKNISSNIIDIPLEDASEVINDELESFNEYFNKKYNSYLYENVSGDKNILNFIYNRSEPLERLIFGEKFIENNKDNIDIFINKKKTPITLKYKFLKGVNEVKVIIKKTITNFEHMFAHCFLPENIEELRKLDTKNGTNFSYMFCYSSPHNYGDPTVFKVLENWDVSNGKNFSYMFNGHYKLSLTGLKKWNVSKGIDFSGMFSDIDSITNMNLESWDVSNGINFSYMFHKSSVKEDSLNSWNVSNGQNFSFMFSGCNLRKLKAFANWNVSNGINFEGMFSNCLYLSDIDGLQNWNASKGTNFDYMLSGDIELYDLRYIRNHVKILKQMKLSDKKYIKSMFPNNKRKYIKL